MALLQFEIAGTVISLAEDDGALVVYGSKKYQNRVIKISYNNQRFPYLPDFTEKRPDMPSCYDYPSYPRSSYPSNYAYEADKDLQYETAYTRYKKNEAEYDKSFDRHLARNNEIFDRYQANERKETVPIIERNNNGILVYAAVFPRLNVGTEISVEVKFLNEDIRITEGNVVTVFKGNISEVAIME